jgi:protein-S-isoprenylcysteine O-methyltransferase Ste14
MSLRSEPVQNNAPDNANVIALPPLVYAAAFVVGWLIHLAFPVIVLPDQPARVIGVLLVLASFSIAITALRALRQAKTTFDTMKLTTAIVTEGPFH